MRGWTTDDGRRTAGARCRAEASRFGRAAGLLVLAAATVSVVAAQDAGAFARIAMGARSAAFPAQVADRSGYASPFLNPALAPFQPAQGVELSAGALAFDRSLETVQVAAPLKPRSGIAAGVVHGGVDNIDGRDASGFPTDGQNEDGTLRTDEYAFFATFGTQFSERVSGGVGLRLYRNELFEGVRAPTAIGIALGASVQLSQRLSAGLAVDDLFARYEWSSSGSQLASVTDYFPTRVRGGLAYAGGAVGERPRFTVAAEAELAVQPRDAIRPSGIRILGTSIATPDTTLEFRIAGVTGRVGGELWVTDGFAVRGGLDRIGAGEVGELRPSAGFGLEQRVGELDLRVDYAVVVEPFGSALMHLATVRLGL
ncbi:hypothetical protein [Rubrivirga sp. IMCC43871]|uniref:hypothetical protein n=1 Tax=Rubrivirga sp. IMCC43871 TaxID=3391575 RepID=UPI00398FF694